MRKERKSKLMPILMTLILLLAVIILVPQSTLAAPAIDEISKTLDLTCGETIWVNASGLNEDERYYVKVWNGTGFKDLDDKRADANEEVSIKINVPGWKNLDSENIVNPLGTWNISLHNSSGQLDAMNITISSLYDVKYKVGGNWIDHAVYNKTYNYPNSFYFYVYNWTGSKYMLLEEAVTITLYEPNDVEWNHQSISTGIWDVDITFDYDDSGNYETEYIINVTMDAARYGEQIVPVKLNISAVMPTNLEWGDEIQISNGYVRDGKGNGIEGYNISLYSPIEGGYRLITYTNTYSTGRFSIISPTDENGGSAGTWCLGTYSDVGSHRLDETDKLDIADFIKYYSIDIASDDSAKVKVESPDELVSGFNQTINVSIYNSWDGDHYDKMWIHVTGVKSYNSTTNMEYDDDDVVLVHANVATGVTDTLKYAYYRFKIKFNETGTGTIIVTNPLNDENYTDIDDLEANITGSVNFQVVSPGDMTVIIDDMVDEVSINKITSCQWKNTSNEITIQIYGDDQSDEKNASIEITGCGLDIKIDEEDAVSDGYMTPPDYGIYTVKIDPKTAGTITITAHNDTGNASVSKDFGVKGLFGSVTTSEGDNKEISVQSTETVIAEIANGQYAEVHLTYYDENWIFIECMNETTGDNTPGSGEQGRFEFVVTEEDIEEGVGYIVVAAEAGVYYMYDIIEVAPLHDMIVDITDPVDAANQTLTVGMEHAWEFEVLDGNGNLIDDIDSVTAEILDNDGDVIQTEPLKEKSGNIWYMDDFIPHFRGELLITAVNNSGENEHDGNITLDVERAEITYSPEAVTCGIGLDNITVAVTAVDANGVPLPDGTKLYINMYEAANTTTNPAETEYFILDEDGNGEFDIEETGDVKGKINVTLQSEYTNYEGNTTDGQLRIVFPSFIVEPSEIYINMANTITIIALDSDNNPIPGINITLTPSTAGIIPSQPEPVETNANGKVTLSVAPVASGNLNVTIARNVRYVGGLLIWDNSVITNTTIKVTGKQSLDISVSKSPIHEGETLTVTIRSGGTPVSGVDVEFGQVTSQTDSNGEATFTVPDPGVESAIYTVTAKKTGYATEEKTISVIKRYEISIVGPSADPQTGSSFTVTVLAKGSGLAGASVTFEGTTKTSDNNGKVTFTAPSDDGNYVITASYETYQDGTLTIKIVPGGIPGFELLTLIAAIGVAFILLRRRRH